MSANWDDFLREVRAHVKRLDDCGCVNPYFRGHSSAHWQLVPGLGRLKNRDPLENRLYGRFWSQGGHLLPSGLSTWDVLFLMQHHGLPTRLLDWSESFAIALYFAVHTAKAEAVVTVLDPYELNRRTFGESHIVDLNTSFPAGYERLFADPHPEVNGFAPIALAVYGKHLSSRMQWQRAVFTFHRDLDNPLELLHPECIQRFTFPAECLKEARDFLRLAGVNEFTTFPDLDGLARYLRECELS